jgi:Zn-dependent oligopeptidase
VTNPFFEKWTTKYGAVPFNDIKLEHFMPAIEQFLADARKNIEKMKQNSEKPNFANTILALETASEDLDVPVGIFYNLMSSESNNEHKALADQISPMMSQFRSEISTDSVIFDKVKTVYENRATENLNSEQHRLLEDVYSSFVRNGALLNNEDKQKLLEIDKKLSVLSPTFTKNVLNATNSYWYHTTDANEIIGIPENDLKIAEFRAKSKNHESGWLFNLQMPSVTPVLTYADNRDLRERISMASGTRCTSGEFDTRDIIIQTAKLRYERAKLLGYQTHSEYILERRMAEDPETVMSFLNRIKDIAMPVAKREIDELTEFAKKTDGITDFKSWDSAYYSEKLKKEKYGFDAEELKPYFNVENCIKGIFAVAEKMYGLRFVRNTEIPGYHADVEVYEVFENANDFVGLLYIDLFPRETKSGGAWMTSYLSQGLSKGTMKRPHISIVGNFTPSTPDSPSLLSLREVETLFHEFGHALHGLLSDVTYPSLASPQVWWDFVELPSHIMENWVLEYETLVLFAHHHQTGEVIPRELIEKVKSAATYQKGIFNIRQLNFGLLDMSYHNINPENITDVIAFEDKTLDPIRLFPKAPGTAISTIFSHIFAGGYSSGYYSYKWAEVLDADAFEKFKEDGIFNPETAKSFRQNILSRGNTAHPMDLYVAFRGRKPDPDAMLRRDGLL